MSAEKKLKELMVEFRSLKTETEKIAFDKKMSRLLAEMSTEERKTFRKAFLTSARQTVAEAKEIKKELEELTGFPCVIGNDANVAALGEMWKGGGEGTKNLIMATLGTGVGGGIIVDGKIVTGAHGAGGEIGHAFVEPEETESCNCGNKGCLEQLASATGIVRIGKKIMAENTAETKLHLDNFSAKTIFDAYKEGDSVAKQIVDKFAEYLGTALAVFTCVVDPEVIVIGGGVSKAGQPLIDAVAGYYKEHAFISCKDTPIVLAKLDNDAGIYGAAKLVVA